MLCCRERAHPPTACSSSGHREGSRCKDVGVANPSLPHPFASLHAVAHGGFRFMQDERDLEREQYWGLDDPLAIADPGVYHPATMRDRLHAPGGFRLTKLAHSSPLRSECVRGEAYICSVSLPENVEMKFARAKRHADELRLACEAFLATEPYSYTRTVEGGSGPGLGAVHVFRWKTFQTPPRELGLIAGDAIHNARSALDHLAVHIDAWGARLAGRGYSERDERRVQFPITTSPEDFETAKLRLPNATPEAIESIESFQPYKVSGSPDMAESRLLSELDNVDKHRSIAPIGFAITYAIADWPAEVFPAHEHASFYHPRDGENYGDPGTEVLRLTFPSEYTIAQTPCELRFGVALFSIPRYNALDAKIDEWIATVRSYAEQIAGKALPAEERMA